MCHGQLLSQSLVKARKEHWCMCCSRPIQPGSKYVRSVAAVDYGIQQSKLCPRCQAWLEVFYEEGGADEDYCFSLNELQSLIRDRSIGMAGWWRKMRVKLRAKMAEGANGSWHT